MVGLSTASTWNQKILHMFFAAMNPRFKALAVAVLSSVDFTEHIVSVEDITRFSLPTGVLHLRLVWWQLARQVKNDPLIDAIGFEV